MKTFTRLAGFFGLFILNGALLMAQTPSIIKDIRVGPIGSAPDLMVRGGNDVNYFVADDGGNGLELWKTDGTTAGTIIVKDINPGINSSNPTSLTYFNNVLYFFADDQVHGRELWKSDGTEAGTVLVKDINEGTPGSDGLYLTPISGYLAFTANDGVKGVELWRTDGSDIGTTMILDINPTVIDGDTTASSSPNGNNNSFKFVRIGANFYFSAQDGTNGRELWKSDGTAAGTSLIKNIKSGASSSGPQDFTVLNSVVYFAAEGDAPLSAELWKTDGTGPGTVVVKAINSPDTRPLGPRQLINVSGILYFTAFDPVNGEEVWKTDGTDAGTVLVSDINPGTAGSNPIIKYREGLGILYFRAQNATAGLELWKTDGTSTSMVADINPTGDSDPYYFFSQNNKVYFAANDGTHGVELWQTDMTSGLTTLVMDIYMGSNGSNPQFLTAFGSTIFFFAEDASNGKELWTLDASILTPNEQSVESIVKQASPNPTTGNVTITGIKETETLSLFNQMGILMNTYQGEEIVAIDLSAQSNGIYIVRSSEGGALKIIKQ
ncbi:MAG: hypothetical protein K0R51_2392 [Cytophagaceae bacterium]|nr:hypothetical protein [Cytophagaceae bacterium]